MPPVVAIVASAAVAGAAAAGIIGVVGTVAASLAIGFGSYLWNRREYRKRESEARRAAEAARQAALDARRRTIVLAEAPRQIVLGEVMTAGVLFALSHHGGADARVNRFRVVYASHPVDSVVDLYLNGEPMDINFGTSGGADRVWGVNNLGVNGSSGDSFKAFFASGENITVGGLLGGYGTLEVADQNGKIFRMVDWKPGGGGVGPRGCAWAEFEVEQDSQWTRGGFPNVGLVLRGAKVRNFYDRQITTRAEWDALPASYSNDPYLCFAWWLMDFRREWFPSGLQVDDTHQLALLSGLLMPPTIFYPTSTGGLIIASKERPQNTISLVADTNTSVRDLIRSFIDATASDCIDEGWGLRLRQNRYRPPIRTLTEADFLSSLSLSPQSARRDSSNQLRVVFANRDKNYASDEIVLTDSESIAEDGGVVKEERLVLDSVSDEYRARALGWLRLRRLRLSATIDSAVLKWRHIDLDIGDLLILDLPHAGFCGARLWRLSAKRFLPDGIEVSFDEDWRQAYDWPLDTLAELKPYPRPPALGENCETPTTTLTFDQLCRGRLTRALCHWQSGAVVFESDRAWSDFAADEPFAESNLGWGHAVAGSEWRAEMPRVVGVGAHQLRDAGASASSFGADGALQTDAPIVVDSGLAHGTDLFWRITPRVGGERLTAAGLSPNLTALEVRIESIGGNPDPGGGRGRGGGRGGG